jgi:hypothetical protein
MCMHSSVPNQRLLSGTFYRLGIVIAGYSLWAVMSETDVFV